MIYSGRKNDIEVNSADAAVMEIVKSNMIDRVPFQLLYYGLDSNTPVCISVAISGIPISNVFSLFVGIQRFSLAKDTSQKWIASPLRNP